MKASEMISLLAKQIELNGDRDINLCVYAEEHTLEGRPLSVTWDEENRAIEIYGE